MEFDDDIIDQEEQESPEVSIDDSIDAEFERITSEQQEPDQTASIARDERGRFAPKPAESEAADDTKPPADPPLSAPSPTSAAPNPAESQPTSYKPSSWKPEELGEWDKAPPSVRAAVERREKEINAYMQQSAPLRQAGEQIFQIAQPYLPALQSVGTDPIRAFHESLQVFNTLKTGTPEQRTAMVYRIAQQYGVPLGQQQDDAQTPSYADPMLTATQQDVQALKTSLAQMQYQEQQREQQRTLSEISAFANGKPHFDAVRSVMGGLMQSGQAATLQDAYDLAIWAVPEVRAKVMAEQEAQRKAEAAKAVQAAKTASSVNVSRRGAPAASAGKPKTIDQGLEAKLDELWSA